MVVVVIDCGFFFLQDGRCPDLFLEVTYSFAKGILFGFFPINSGFVLVILLKDC